jgi:hypothetical protein
MTRTARAAGGTRTVQDNDIRPSPPYGRCMSLLSRTSPAHDSRIAGRWRALALLATAMVLSMTTWFSASAVLPQLRTAWTLSPTEAAWLTIAVQLGFVTGALASAVTNLPDRVPARRVFFAASVGAATVNGLVAVCHGPRPRCRSGSPPAASSPASTRRR